jgi:hypothetical protein
VEWRLAHRRRGAGNFSHERIELGPAGFGDGEVAELVGQRAKLRGVLGAGGAIQVEKTTDIHVARLAGVETMEGFDFHAGKEMRQMIAGGNHGDRVPAAHLGHAEQVLAFEQIFRAGTVEEPGRFITARTDRRLQRAQNGQRVPF